ncbi:MAG: LysR family transcriptional regulator [Crocinitomicaceae bacterium]|nr:LysR family transcriptional regulator [Crocinitomicaceae bacterium]MDG1777038.1 LysR family transcriptional regulator [Crocinitomicaceae bacterium]
MKIKNSFKVHSRIWISTEDGSYLGEGRIALLKEIQTHKSIAKAAKSMKMSYKKAWSMVNSMNMISNTPLVIRTTGGTGGGGSKITETGIKAIKLFNEIKISSQQHLDSKIDQLDFS